MSTAEPSINDLSPMSKAGPTNLEPAFLLDTSGSMSYPTTDGGSVRRMDLVGEALPLVVAGLEKFDAQAAKESEAAGDEEGWGHDHHLRQRRSGGGGPQLRQRAGEVRPDQVGRRPKGGTYVCVAVVGFGPEHDKTMAQYGQIAQANNHVRVLTFADSTNPQDLADGLLAMFGG